MSELEERADGWKKTNQSGTKGVEIKLRTNWERDTKFWEILCVEKQGDRWISVQGPNQRGTQIKDFLKAKKAAERWLTEDEIITETKSE